MNDYDKTVMAILRHAEAGSSIEVVVPFLSKDIQELFGFHGSQAESTKFAGVFLERRQSVLVRQQPSWNSRDD